MSESIQSAPASAPAQSPKMLIVTALITAMTTIGVSFVGVVPKLTQHDAATIDTLQKELQTVKQGLTATDNKERATVAPGKKKTIDGTVWSEDGKRRMNGVDVFLLPEDGPRLTSQTDDNGKFILSDIPPGVYSIIVRESSGKSIKTYLYENEEEAKVPGTLIKYRIRDKGDK